jgi:hypothetical protein
MRTSHSAVVAERVLSPAEFELLLRRAEKLQRVGRLRLIKQHRPNKRAASAA